MKIVPVFLAFALFTSLLSAQVPSGPGTTRGVFGTSQANTPLDLQKAIVINSYTWEVPEAKSSVKFNTDGTGKQTFFSFTWTAKNAQQIELSLTGSPNKAEIVFNSNYTSFTGTDFDAQPIHGTLILPPKAAATPPPIAAAPTPAMGGATGPASMPPPTSALAPVATPPPKASGEFFNHLNGTLDAPSTGGGGDLEKAIVGSTYTWEVDGYSGWYIKFSANGAATWGGNKASWKAKGSHEVEVTLEERGGGKARLHFSTDYNKYSGSDFYDSDVKGHKK